MLLDPTDLFWCQETLGVLERLDGWSWFFIYLVGHWRKAIFFGIIEESAFLEKKGYVLRSTDLYSISLLHDMRWLQY